MKRAACGLTAALCCCAPLVAQEVPGASDKIRVERIAAGFGYTEGPAWSRDGFLVFSDVPGNRVLKLVLGQRPETLREMPGGPSGNAFDSQGRLYTCETRARRVVRFHKGKAEVLAEYWEGKRLNAPNDIAVRRDGNAYFTDPAFGYQQDTRELDFYGVFHISPKRELKLVARMAGRPNGVALSPNGRILYVSDSDGRAVRAWDLDGRGAASNERVFVSGIEGIPGGLRTDEHGNLYVAASRIAVYSPPGKLLTTIPITETPSNCAFGDPDGKSLYITAGASVYRVRLDGKGAESH